MHTPLRAIIKVLPEKIMTWDFGKMVDGYTPGVWFGEAHKLVMKSMTRPIERDAASAGRAFAILREAAMGRWDDKVDRAAKKWAAIVADAGVPTARARPDAHHRGQGAPQSRSRRLSVPRHPITLGELNEGINRVANGLLALGVKQGDKVAIMLPNCPEFLYTWFGANKIGAVEVPINVALKGAGLAYQIVQSDSRGAGR